jgi:hypothetical protein
LSSLPVLGERVWMCSFLLFLTPLSVSSSDDVFDVSARWVNPPFQWTRSGEVWPRVRAFVSCRSWWQDDLRDLFLL